MASSRACGAARRPDLDGYNALLGRAIVGGHDPDNVILMEIDPSHQKTLADFLLTERCSVSAPLTSGDSQGRQASLVRPRRPPDPIHRIYNRAIVDELQRKRIPLAFDFRDDLEVEWAGHPNGYFRISKFSIPYLRHPVRAADACFWISCAISAGHPQLRAEAAVFVRRSGRGGWPGARRNRSRSRRARRKYILQERVDFAPVIDTPHGPTKTEMRIMYIWLDQLLRGEHHRPHGPRRQMGVDHNKNLEWVGASAGFLSMTILCLASYEKGHEFLRECKRQGWTVVLVTAESIRNKAHWPDGRHRRDLLSAGRRPALEPGAHAQRRQLPGAHARLRPHRAAGRFRRRDWPPCCASTCASPAWARPPPAISATSSPCAAGRGSGAERPDFIHVLNHGASGAVLERVPAPWVLKPRSMAGAIGIRKFTRADEFWGIVESLGDEQSNYLLERFVPGDIFHVTPSCRSARSSSPSPAVRTPPLEVSHGGGIFTTRTLERDSDDGAALLAENERVLVALGLVRGVSHTEYILGREDGRDYFLETSARVGGAHIAELVEAATGINLWAEWAKVEIAGGKAPYSPPAPRAGLRRAHRFARAPGASRHHRNSTTRKSSGACPRSTMSG